MVIYAPLLILTLAVLHLPLTSSTRPLPSIGISVSPGAPGWAIGQSARDYLILGSLFIWILYGVIRRPSPLVADLLAGFLPSCCSFFLEPSRH